MEKFVYHRIPPLFQGDQIYSLNALEDIYPDAYRRAISKYKGREDLVNAVIPGVDLKWNDFIFCSPLHPAKIAAAIVKAGRRPEDQKLSNYFKIPVEITRGRTAIWYKYKHWKPGQDSNVFDPRDFEEFSPERYQELDDVPGVTKTHYEERLKNGGILFPWHLVPHVLISSPLSIKDLEIINA